MSAYAATNGRFAPGPGGGPPRPLPRPRPLPGAGPLPPDGAPGKKGPLPGPCWGGNLEAGPNPGAICGKRWPCPGIGAGNPAAPRPRPPPEAPCMGGKGGARPVERAAGGPGPPPWGGGPAIGRMARKMSAACEARSLALMPWPGAEELIPRRSSSSGRENVAASAVLCTSFRVPAAAELFTRPGGAAPPRGAAAAGAKALLEGTNAAASADGLEPVLREVCCCV